MRLEFDVAKAKRILPLTVIFVLMMAFNNLCLLYVQVSFYQVRHT
jgi:GDP-fucose transporter C1